jgi:hypothetical protein
MLPTNLDAQSEITKPFISGQTQKPGVGLVPGTWHQDHLYRPGNPWQNGWIESSHARLRDALVIDFNSERLYRVNTP